MSASKREINSAVMESNWGREVTWRRLKETLGKDLTDEKKGESLVKSMRRAWRTERSTDTEAMRWGVPCDAEAIM